MRRKRSPSASEGKRVPLISDKGYIRNIDSVEERQLRREEPGGLVLGFSWYEPPPEQKPRGNDRLIALGAACVLGAVVLVASSNYTVIPGVLLLVVSIPCIGFGLMAKPKITDLIVNALVFRTDGEIRATNPWKAKMEGDEVEVHWDTLKRRIDDIKGIALQPMKANDGSHYKHNAADNDRTSGYRAYSIEVDFSTGERFTAGRYLNEDDGRIVQVQLNQAWEKICQIREQQGLMAI